ncbi:uncharacterized protein BDR25DRAFT_283893 [Lindgomyces ingoldianus]|uniref:Uncharacterized protein n=1 Tax=Lindgomyces ingoldianus TaxID=673940 RepID=A0ACB6QZX2_9PLEO|nr:uncharacterized protein BDR25DRAFT_283893 [Lindgomyces ingoldianus]KAF2472451.1 hypothetical protein BDR25DRAFT_283893 [Lindgomyces ingoldianus]
MASSSTDAHSQPKRAQAMARQSSTSSHVSQSPSDSHARAAPHKGQRQHVVGQSRMQRNTSLGKNLNKLSKLAQVQQGDGSSTKHHRRSHSGNSTSAPSSPRPSFKRNASSGAIVRAANHTHSHTGIRKNHSSGHLSRQGSSKNMLKSSKSEIAPPKRSLAHPGKARQLSPDPHPTVHFDIGNEEGADDGWTEESASQSPTTTRSNTRSNSVILDPHKAMHVPEVESTQGESPQMETSSTPARPPPSTISHALPDRTLNARLVNGASSHQHSRPPDADMITSRLLQRHSSHNPPPQMSSIAAMVVSDSHDARVLSQSAGSTLVDTPGRDLVSRFMDGDGSAGTPKDSSFLPSRNSPQSAGNDFDKAKRNKSMPNVVDTETPPKAQSRRSGTSTPTNLPPSRTQQKLLLQRASSNIEPQKLVPAILPRTGGPQFIHAGITYNANGEGRLDPRLQQRFNQVEIEYKVVQRYRNPLADGIMRIEQIPGTRRKHRVPRSSSATNGFVNVHGSSSLSTSFNESGVETDGSGARRRSRVSFESHRGRDDDDLEGRQSFESDGGRVRNEAEEICRRLWESAEMVEGD